MSTERTRGSLRATLRTKALLCMHLADLHPRGLKPHEVAHHRAAGVLPDGIDDPAEASNHWHALANVADGNEPAPRDIAAYAGTLDRQIQVRVTLDGDDPFGTSLADFAADNEDVDDVLAWARQTTAGHTRTFGGGAAPAFTVTLIRSFELRGRYHVSLEGVSTGAWMSMAGWVSRAGDFWPAGVAVVGKTRQKAVDLAVVEADSIGEAMFRTVGAA